MRVALAQWGELLGTRGLGAQVRSSIAAALAIGPVDVDFSGVRLASESFLDEAFARLSEEVPVSVLRKRCRILNANDSVLTMLRVAVRERKRLRQSGGAA